jgi:thiol-disulfide isomerase/thioredoxin
MRLVRLALAFACLSSPIFAQDKTDGPSNDKAQKTYKRALEYLRKWHVGEAFDDFKKADKQDGGHCLPCQKQMIKYGVQFGDWKAAELGAEEIVAEVRGAQDTAVAHYQLAVVLVNEGTQKHKDEFFARAHDEITKALAAAANFPDALFIDGKALAQLHQDEAAKARFEQFVKAKPEGSVDRQRALRFISQPELARARMAPPFLINTLDGRQISMDDLQGKVVLLDFWATWCAPCREALPHIREVAKKFQGQPLVIVSISLDTDETKWKDFVGKNEMTWPQYFDGGFTGPVSKMFGVTAIPHTFTVDADGVLQDEHIGDASIEGKLKKLLARARELQSTQLPAAKPASTVSPST